MTGILLTKAVDGQCRWETSGPIPQPARGPHDLFRGRRVCGCQVRPGSSFCPEHHARAYVAASEPGAYRDDSTVRRAPPSESVPELTEIFDDAA